MTRDQLRRFEMFQRVGDFRETYREAFPPSSPCRRWLDEVSEVLREIERQGVVHLHAKDRTRAWKPRQREVNPREVAYRYMKRIALAARRVPWEQLPHPFHVPRPRTITRDLAAAQRFIEEGERHRDVLVRAGLPETFVADFRALVDQLQQDLDRNRTGWTERAVAMHTKDNAFRRGLAAVRHLDVAMPFAAEQTPALLWHWQHARRISGLRKSTRATKKTGYS